VQNAAPVVLEGETKSARSHEEGRGRLEWVSEERFHPPHLRPSAARLDSCRRSVVGGGRVLGLVL